MYEKSRLFVRVQFCVLLIAFWGCDSDRSRVPVPLTETPPFSYQGAVKRIWGGDNFEIEENDRLHFAYMRGIDAPESGQFGHEAAIDLIDKLAKSGTVKIDVINRDQWKREVCEMTFVVAGKEIDPAMELLEKGLAWFDHSESPRSQRYRDAEAKARDAKIGIWSQPDPVPPWEYWERRNKNLTEVSK
jgi:endonuclease YncB( thermonuclease family)